MKLFYKTNSKIEKKIDLKIKKLLYEIKKNKTLKKYVKIFGLTGPAARGQASSKGSDIDFYCITNCLNPFHEKKLKKVFFEVFSDFKIEVSLLVFAPSIFKKPDLMYFEFTNSGKIFYGSLNQKISINKIPLWEGIRLLTFKGDPFLASFDTGEFHYYYSKLLLGIGEAFLVLDRTYVADNFKRHDLVLKNKYCLGIEGFMEEYQKAHDFRYNGYVFKGELKKKGLLFLKKAWQVYLKEYLGDNYLVRLRKIKPLTLKERVGTKVFYTINYWKMFKEFRVAFKEPFIREILMLQKYLESENDTLRLEIIKSWKATPRFWYLK